MKRFLLASGLPRLLPTMRIASAPLIPPIRLILDHPPIAVTDRMPNRTVSTNTKKSRQRWTSTFNHGRRVPSRALALHLMAVPSLIRRQTHRFSHQLVTHFCRASSLETGICPVRRILSGVKVSLQTGISPQGHLTRQMHSPSERTIYRLLKTLWKT